MRPTRRRIAFWKRERIALCWSWPWKAQTAAEQINESAVHALGGSGAPVFPRFSSCHRSPRRPWPGVECWVVMTSIESNFYSEAPCLVTNKQQPFLQNESYERNGGCKHGKLVNGESVLWSEGSQTSDQQCGDLVDHPAIAQHWTEHGILMQQQVMCFHPKSTVEENRRLRLTINVYTNTIEIVPLDPLVGCITLYLPWTLGQQFTNLAISAQQVIYMIADPSFLGAAIRSFSWWNMGHGNFNRMTSYHKTHYQGNHSQLYRCLACL